MKIKNPKIRVVAGLSIPLLVQFFESKANGESLADSIDDLESDSSKAISQIEEKGYFRNMKGRTLLYGISFNGKSSRISMKEMTD